MSKSYPDNMQAIDFEAPGGPEVLVPVQMPCPVPGSEDVLVRVSAAGVNRPDVMQRKGMYPPPKGAPPSPGLEIAGEIVAVGEHVSSSMMGQHVCALVAGGGYAEYCVAKAAHCLPVPDGLTMAEAAALPETLFTVWHNLFERGCARDGETALIHGGTSGIGTMAILLGKQFGLKVIVTCGTDKKCKQARELGAVEAINYRESDFAEAVNDLTDGRGADVILDMVAGDYVARNMSCLAADGRHVTIALQGGVMAEISMVSILTKRQTLTGSTLRPRSDAFKALLAAEIAQNAWPLVEDGSLRPVMDKSFPLAAAADAHSRMEAGDHFGKIVLLNS